MSAENGVSSSFWSQHSSPSPTLISSFVLCTHILHATAAWARFAFLFFCRKLSFFSAGSSGQRGGGRAAALLQWVVTVCCVDCSGHQQPAACSAAAVTLDLTLSCPLHSCSLHSCCTKLPPHCTAPGQHQTEVKRVYYYLCIQDISITYR